MLNVGGFYEELRDFEVSHEYLADKFIEFRSCIQGVLGTDGEAGTKLSITPIESDTSFVAESCGTRFNVRWKPELFGRHDLRGRLEIFVEDQLSTPKHKQIFTCTFDQSGRTSVSIQNTMLSLHNKQLGPVILLTAIRCYFGAKPLHEMV